MTRLAEDYDYVIGGDPDRDSIDLAVLDTATGSIRAHIEATADGPGYARMLEWARHTPLADASGRWKEREASLPDLPGNWP
jgi:transposase